MTKEKINPQFLFKQWNIKHITFNPNLKESDCDFFRRKRQSHDGTVLFTIRMLQDLLLPLVNMEKVNIKSMPDPTRELLRVEYEVGYIKLATTYTPKVQREGCRISVKSKCIYATNN